MTTRPSDIARRALDVTVGTLGLAIAAPVLAAGALAVRAVLGPGVLYRAERLGRGGHPFTLLKLRSMRHAAPGQEGSEFDQLRLGRLGRWLRATSIDELPSLVNLVRGDIGLVGPRPLPVSYWDRFRGDEYRRFDVRPGITGLAQINGRNTLDWDARLALDVDYVRTRTLRGDLAIMVKTVPAVLGRRGVDHAEGVTMHALPADRPG